MNCPHCNHPIKAHAYNGPDGHLAHTFPCLACDCKAPSPTGPCANCGKYRAAHHGGECPNRPTTYAAPVSFAPATAAGIAALIAQIDAPDGFSPDFRDGMDYLTTELSDRLED